ncbi:hypothetical protein [Endothiovibrio diazotrophicus]
MTIHVILEFETREEALQALGKVEAQNIVEWFDDRELGAAAKGETMELVERETTHRLTA